MSAPLLSFDRATIGRGGCELLRDVSFTVARGELVAILGLNGVGKSTLLAAALGDLPLLGGTVQLCGHAPATLRARERARLVAVLPEAEPLPYDVPVRDVIELGRYAHVGLLGRLGAADAAAVERAIEWTRSAPLLTRGINELSAGERQRVLLARALAQEPQLVLLDEPTAHLDPGRSQQVMQTLRERVDDGTLGVLAVLHEPNLAGHYADRIVLLERGGVLAQGTPRDVLRPELLARAYDVPFRSLADPEGGAPWVFAMGGRR